MFCIGSPLEDIYVDQATRSIIFHIAADTMKINGTRVYQLGILFSLCFYSFFFLLRSQFQLQFESPSTAETEKFTVRVNTFRRNDLLTAFLAHYTTCSKVLI